MGFKKRFDNEIEGIPLKYFNTDKRRLAYPEGEEQQGEGLPWWLRTSHNSYQDKAMFITYYGGAEALPVNYGIGVRPAFCLNPAVPVKKSNDIVAGKSVYAIDLAKVEQGLPELPQVAVPTRYMIKAVSSNESYGGIVASSGLRRVGNEVEVQAFPNKGHRFEGWYEGDTLISPESEYYFPAERDVSLVAQFAVIDNAHYLTLIAGEGGGVSRKEGEYPPGERIHLIASSLSGYEFKGWRTTGGDFEMEHAENVISFVMPDYDVTVYADFKKKE
jgi:uncharacterized repeat protein (TIGR02543 family)